MSLLPYLFDKYSVFRPSRLLDQRFGLALDPEGFLQPLTVPRLLTRCPEGYVRNWKSAVSDSDAGSTVSLDNDKFKAVLDVPQFKPEEISVKITGEKVITIESKHGEKKDQHGQIYRHFIRRYTLPQGCDINKVESKLSSDGVLTITAPRTKVHQIEYKSIPITQTDEHAIQVEFAKHEETPKCIKCLS